MDRSIEGLLPRTDRIRPGVKKVRASRFLSITIADVSPRLRGLRQELRCARKHGRGNNRREPESLATVWLIDVVANKFGVIGWRVYRDVGRRRLASPLTTVRTFLWKLIGSKILTVSRRSLDAVTLDVLNSGAGRPDAR